MSDDEQGPVTTHYNDDPLSDQPSCGEYLRVEGTRFGMTCLPDYVTCPDCLVRVAGKLP